jgi:hypothetical protein
MRKEEEYLANAEECEQNALRTTSAADRATWLEMAASWRRKLEPAKAEEHRNDSATTSMRSAPNLQARRNLRNALGDLLRAHWAELQKRALPEKLRSLQDQLQQG